MRRSQVPRRSKREGADEAHHVFRPTTFVALPPSYHPRSIAAVLPPS